MLSAVRRAGGARGAHHVEHACREAEEQEHDQAPRRDVEPAVEQPAHQGPDQHAADELGREPETAAEPGSVGLRSRRSIRLVRPARSNAVEPFAEAPQPRRESSLVGGSRTGVLVARAHECDTRKCRKFPVFPPPPKPRGPY